tara:strand:+ start:315 stop:587 length:273 start_codon:yes stop_codon:yes gene_type:complete
MNTKKQKKPDWFNGSWYTNGDTVTNPFSGESFVLTGPELSMYDFIMGAQMVLEMKQAHLLIGSSKVQNEVRKGINWFRKNNPKAYMVLLD